MERKPIQTGAIIGLILLIVLELIRIFISPLSINVYVIGYIICLFIGSVIAGTKNNKQRKCMEKWCLGWNCYGNN